MFKTNLCKIGCNGHIAAKVPLSRREIWTVANFYAHCLVISLQNASALRKFYCFHINAFVLYIS